MECIICELENTAQSIEHIVSESLGNETYVMERSRICDVCNNRLSRSERLALSHTIFLMVRARNGIKTKAGKPAKGKIVDLEIEGDENFKKQHIFAPKLQLSRLKDFNPKTNTYSLYVDSFDKNEVPTSKTLLKMAIESIFTSQRQLYKKYRWTEIREFLKGENTLDWPFLTSSCHNFRFVSIPRYQDRFDLRKIQCELFYCEVDENTLLFKFRYGEVEMVINLLNRDLAWTLGCLVADNKARLYPKHFRRKVEMLEKKLMEKES